MSRPQQRGYRTCIPFVPFWATCERCEGNTSFACVLDLPLGATVILTGTHQDQLPKRAYCTKMPRSRLVGSPVQYATFSSVSLSVPDIALPNLQNEGKLSPEKASRLCELPFELRSVLQK